jgi:N-acetylglucosamine-6-phosphate deacetylase
MTPPPSSPQHGARRTVLAGARVVRPGGIDEAGRVAVEGGRLTAALPQEPHGTEVVDLTGHWLVPGFVDLHVHGGGGASFSAGSAEEALTAIATHRRHGTTTMLASTVTGTLQDLAAQAGVLAELARRGEIAGVHFEGPFIALGRHGAHDPALLRPPAAADVRRLLAAAEGWARMVTLEPELPGGRRCGCCGTRA